MKIAPLYHELKTRDWCLPQVVHSGQHYDYNMSAAFFKDLGLSDPDFHLGVGSGSHGEQTGRCLIAYEKVLQETRPDWVVVVGDVNSTMACALAARKLLIPVAHLEAGLRSFDRTMPEETNRLVTDAIADLLWTHSPEAGRNLLREGIPAQRIEQVGNIMIDSLEMLRSRIEAEQEGVLKEQGLTQGGFGLVTLHRPSNVDQAETLTALVETLNRLGRELPLVFPLHPRTRERLTSFGLWEKFASAPGIKILDPLGYIRFMGLVLGCRAGYHRLWRSSGGDHLPGHPLLHPPAQHREAGDRQPRHQPAGGAVRPGEDGGRGIERRAAARLGPRPLGRPHRRPGGRQPEKADGRPGTRTGFKTFNRV